MAKTTLPVSYLRIAGFSLFASMSALVGCASDDDMLDPMLLPPAADGGFTADASAITTADGGLPVQTTADSGGSVSPGIDSGNVVAQPDAGTTAQDAASVVPDGGGSVPDAAPPVMRPDQGMGDGKDVITMGDSWMNLSSGVGIENSLERVSKRDYRNFGVSGTRLLDEAIPTQYTNAKREGAIKTVIMTGGGNDILQDLNLGILGGCNDDNIDKDSTMACKKRIDEVAARLTKLWADMSKDGVQDVVIVAYTAKATILGNVFKKSVAYSSSKIPPLCAAVAPPLRCWTVDSDLEVPDLALRDGIHPDDKGYEAIGTAVWKLMQAQGMRR
jgi:lysophospholipase L1-like esterase